MPTSFAGIVEVMESHGNFIAGGEREGGVPLMVRNPYDGAVIGQVTQATPDVVDAAVQAAVRAQPQMAALTREARAKILDKVADGIWQRRDELAKTLLVESGKPITYARVEVARAVDTFRASAGAARGLAGEEIPIDAQRPGEGRLAFTRRFPVGPILAITPFNFPLNLVAHKVAPAIAAGCASVVKPASTTPLSALKLAAICQDAGLPAGGMNVVVCEHTSAQTLVEDDRFKLLSFTGSAAVGWRMKRDAGKKKVVLELGGNAAVIVLPDADLDGMATRVAVGGYYQAGQSCISVQRVYVHKDVYARATEAITSRVNATPFGDPAIEATVCGPLIDAANAERVVAWIGEALSRGAERLAGGPREGSIVPPTLLARVPRDARVVCEEVFGPVVVLEEVASLDEAIQRASDSRYGLQCGIFTNSLQAVLRAWNEIPVGALIHNDVPAYRVDLMPYGGVKDSGLGREGPREAVLEMTEQRLCVLRP
jgi:acyl-CoA reductase-like NAD-dependent aldehyde dehydrogenase